jgi:hypothetical protein
MASLPCDGGNLIGSGLAEDTTRARSMTLENANGALIGEERNRRRHGRYCGGDIERRPGAFEPASSRDRYSVIVETWSDRRGWLIEPV